MTYPKQQKGYLLFLMGTAILLSSSVLVSELRTSSPSQNTQEHEAAPNDMKYLASNTLCTDTFPDNTSTFTTQAYRGAAYKDDSTRLMVHFKNAFTQGELACGSNSTSTALYGQKNMITRFVQELDKIESKKGTQANYNYIRTQARKLQEEAAKRNMNQGQWLDCYGGEPAGMLCRKLTNIDGLEALFPNIVAQVKARGNKGYTANDIYDFNSGLTDGREFIDGTINLSFPLDHPQRGMPRWQQDLFKEFVQREFNSYDAQMYLSPLGQDPRFNNASTNPTLNNGKTLYVAYKERLRDYKKFPPYVSNLEKINSTNTAQNAGSTTSPTTQLPGAAGNSLITNDPTQAGPVPQKGGTVIIPLPPTKTTDDRTKELIQQPKITPLPSADQIYMISIPQQQATITPTTRILQQGTIPSSTTTNTQYQYQQNTTPTSSSRTLRY